uniref:Uncharacterized protein n=1 Tax=Propithecus coquereli TaxID=379532 RepID=A0A2K6GNG0_PROCO
MTLRCLESSGNGADGTRSQWGTAGSAEEPSPEAARLAKGGRDACGRGRARRRGGKQGIGWKLVPSLPTAQRTPARPWILGNA